MTLKSALLSSGAFGGMTANEQRQGRFLRDGAGHPEPKPTPAPAPAPEPEVSDDAFDTAFEEHSAEEPATGGADDAGADSDDGDGAGAAATGDGADAGGDGAGAAAPAADPNAGGDVPAPAEEGGEEGAQPAEPVTPAAKEPAASAQPSADDILKGLTEAIKNSQASQPKEAQPQPDETPFYSQEEQTVLATYEENWPDVSKAETLKRKAEYHDLIKYVFEQVAGLFTPVQDQLRTIETTLHMGELKTAVPDYSEDLEQQVADWVETQPAYLQSAYKQVMQTGTSEEVADLIGRYRQASGSAPAAPQVKAPADPAPAAPAKPAPAAKTELSSAAKQAAESLAPVSGERSQVPQGEDPQDFDSAFKKYAATM